MLVALSRVRSIDDLSLQFPIHKNQIKAYSDVKIFYQKLQDEKEIPGEEVKGEEEEEVFTIRSQ